MNPAGPIAVLWMPDAALISRQPALFDPNPLSRAIHAF
jgi:hypothetical protein